MTTPGPEDPRALSFDRDLAVARLGGDEKLLRDLAQLFLGLGPKLLADVRAALERGDAAARKQTAHGLKSAVGNFAAQTAYDAALRVEKAGADEDLRPEGEAFVALDRAIHQLMDDLAKIA